MVGGGVGIHSWHGGMVKYLGIERIISVHHPNEIPYQE
jgi:hypothetical protein